MRDYIRKMLTEAEDLKGKIKKAELAVENNPFDMDTASKELLKKQIAPMKQYLEILNQRIKHEENK